MSCWCWLTIPWYITWEQVDLHWLYPRKNRIVLRYIWVFLLFLLKLLNDRRGLYYLHYSIDEALSQSVTGISIYQPLSKGCVWFLILLITLNSVVHGGGLVLPILRRQMRYEAVRGNQILFYFFCILFRKFLKYLFCSKDMLFYYPIRTINNNEII